MLKARTTNYWKLLLPWLLAMLLPAVAQAESLVVTVKQTSIRADQKFYAKSKATVSHGTLLDLISSSNDWHKVKYKAMTGWVHNSAVAIKSSTDKDKKTKQSGKPSAISGLGKKFGLGVKKEPTRTTGYSQDDVTLAGKGFSEEVENSYRKKNPKINYKDVDWVERQTASTSKALQFASAGRLSVRDEPPKKKQAAAGDSKKKAESKGESMFDKAKKGTSGFFSKLKPGGKKDSGGEK